jgi:hypothetical protein
MTSRLVLGIEARRNSSLVSRSKRLLAALAYFGLVVPSGAIEYTITDLGTLPGGSYSAGLSINNSGQVVGYSNFSGSGLQAVPTEWNGSAARPGATCRFSLHGSTSLSRAIIGESFCSDDQLTG